MSLQRLLAALCLSCQKVQCAPWELRDTLLDLLLCCWPLRLFHSDRFTIEAQALNHSAMAMLTPLHFTPWPGAEKTQQETNGCHNIIYHHCSLHLRTQSTPPPPTHTRARLGTVLQLHYIQVLSTSFDRALHHGETMQAQRNVLQHVIRADME